MSFHLIAGDAGSDNAAGGFVCIVIVRFKEQGKYDLNASVFFLGCGVLLNLGFQNVSKRHKVLVSHKLGGKAVLKGIRLKLIGGNFRKAVQRFCKHIDCFLPRIEKAVFPIHYVCQIHVRRNSRFLSAAGNRLSCKVFKGLQRFFCNRCKNTGNYQDQSENNGCDFLHGVLSFCFILCFPYALYYTVLTPGRKYFRPFSTLISLKGIISHINEENRRFYLLMTPYAFILTNERCKMPIWNGIIMGVI